MDRVNIRNLSIRCGQCESYQTLENDVCDPEVTRTLVEVPRELDEFARRDPHWHRD
jgi:hypothetical protein